MPGSRTHYFSPSPDTPSRPGTVRLDLPDLSLALRTDRGVFSAGRIDPGTKVLLGDPAELPAECDLLDLGSGYGPIALTMASRAPGARVWAVDVNDRALALVRANAAAAGLANVVAARPDDVPGDLRFAALWSNPPVRIGKAALHDLLARWLGRLADGGSARLVVHKHLGADSLQRWLGERGWPVERVRSRLGYRILEVRPATGPAPEPAGPADATGTTSETGEANATGTTDETGEANATGTTDETGEANATGTTDETGGASATGTTGETDKTSATGTTGEADETGTTGEDGGVGA